MNGIIPTMIILLILVTAVFFAVRSIIKDKANGRCSCGASCSHCAMADKCHKQ